MDFSFKKIVDKQYDTRITATAPIPEVDAYIFCTSSKYLGENLFPWQSLLIKLYYGLWEKYPITEAEQKIIDVLKNEWHINIDLTKRDPKQIVEILILVLGRRSGKSTTISLIQTYEAYKLICKGDPQKYYKIRARHPIWLINTAKDGEQAKDPFRLCKDNIRRISFFQKYIDWSKDNEESLRIFTPADLYENEQIKKYNATRPKGTPKKNMLEGSITISSFTTTAASKRGKAIIVLVLDEFAHFDRAKSTSGGMSDEEIVAETPQTDYAMLKALQPSTKDFNIPDQGIFDGKVIMISSPREKGGEFYKHYCLAGGWEQANPQRDDVNPNYLMLQLSTWHCNPKCTEATFVTDFKKDAVGANMEYGAHFGEPSTTFIDSTKIDEMIDDTRHMSYEGMWGYNYIISADPATKGDTYAVCWGHVEYLGGSGCVFVVDGIHGFRSQFVTNPTTNRLIKLPVQPAKVVEFIKLLADNLSKQGRVLEITFDQWSSSDSIATLKKAGYIAVETTFSNTYKNEIYTDFLEKLNMGAVKVASKPPLRTPQGIPPYQFGWLEQTKLELKYLTKITSGNTVYYAAPGSGPVQTDDFPDILANMVHRHILYQSGDRQVVQQLAKQIGHPIKKDMGNKPTTMGNLFRSNSRSNKIKDIKNRIAR